MWSLFERWRRVLGFGTPVNEQDIYQKKEEKCIQFGGCVFVRLDK